MSSDLLMGLAVTAVPLLVAGILFLRKQRAIFLMFVAMVLVGLGYLTATGAIEDIGAKVRTATQANASSAPGEPKPGY